MSVEIRDERFVAIVGEDAALEQLGTGFAFTEGPVWHPMGKYLIFSDMPGNHMRRWSEARGIETFRKPSNMANGNAWDRQGRLVTCEHATSRVTRTEADGSLSVLASHYQGKELNSPNDVVVRRDGQIFFTDPIYGRIEYYGVKRDPELDFRGVYRIDANGELHLLADDFGQPNGLSFSVDESTLYVNDTERSHIRAFDVEKDGSLSNSRLWADVTGEGPGGPDGLKVDSEGNVYCCGPGGIHIFAPDGTSIGVIQTPEVAANFTWGDDELTTFFIAASTSLYRMPVRVPGVPLF